MSENNNILNLFTFVGDNTNKGKNVLIDTKVKKINQDVLKYKNPVTKSKIR